MPNIWCEEFSTLPPLCVDRRHAIPAMAQCKVYVVTSLTALLNAADAASSKQIRALADRATADFGRTEAAAETPLPWRFSLRLWIKMATNPFRLTPPIFVTLFQRRNILGDTRQDATKIC